MDSSEGAEVHALGLLDRVSLPNQSMRQIAAEVAEWAIPGVEARGVTFAQCEVGEFISDRGLPADTGRDAVSFLQAP
jgi:hypothetical protein